MKTNDFEIGNNFIVRDFDNNIVGVFRLIDDAIRACPPRMGRIERVLVAQIENLGR
jgi:hypothetical protein